MPVLGWAKMGADGGCDHLGVALGHAVEHVAQEVHLAALQAAPSSAAAIAVLRPVSASEMTRGVPQHTSLPLAQEGVPDGAVLGVADGEAEHATVAVGGHPGGDHDGL